MTKRRCIVCGGLIESNRPGQAEKCIMCSWDTKYGTPDIRKWVARVERMVIKLKVEVDKLKKETK